MTTDISPQSAVDIDMTRVSLVDNVRQFNFKQQVFPLKKTSIIFTDHRIIAEEASYELSKVKKISLGKRGVPYAITHDGRAIRYPKPLIRAKDTVHIDLASGEITEFIRFDAGKLVMVTGGKNMGKIGVIVHRDLYEGTLDLSHIKDASENNLVTRKTNVLVVGIDAGKPYVSLPKGKGLKLSIAEKRDR